ncbi:MAG TPA: bifunctional riboflavin kinase/FAD synthetase [Bacillota bacterium]|jgi:riboflavin kinase/FMN adenylyltransferase|nr:bifunctional riboflavin kinase/FAD synthetase [Bacillota bacterium]HOA34936.1 bifunctional riboflavin kinase/FAD synthetase [Bacillota bacterium]HOJ84820.1 bifunctional riboflavin kinase/FAD synthetase [Bacillota bacterium]HOL15606.1 bifunctional riboflavin kinase/FAD synthetase [Bacillota bacterium]HPZ11093.1 bifunctional riboflavin kinase/FAD synthetase [Bacillota bacterium]
MEIIYSLNSYSIKKELYLALGNFDGVHLGHQAVIRRAIKQARSSGGAAGAMIFEPHPFTLLNPEKPFCLLTGMEERQALMAQLGLNYLFVEPFTKKTASMSPEEFIQDILLHRFKISGVSIGDDYTFGRGGLGGDELMRQYGERLGFSVSVTPMKKTAGMVISSSAIKKILADGAVEQAARLLNYFFHRRGQVVPGQGRGNKLLYPTANIIPASNLVWPGSGVYLTAIGGLERRVHFGLTNVGTKPTFDDGAFAVETHILDFDGDVYGREITIYFLMRLRDIQNFSSAARLREQIAEDISRGREMAASRFAHIEEFVEPVRFLRPPAD